MTQDGCLRLHVENLPRDVDDAALKKFFRSFGKISDVTIKNNFGFFSVPRTSTNIEDAIKEFTGRNWKGNVISVSKARKDNFMARLVEERKAAKNLKAEQETAPKNRVENSHTIISGVERNVKADFDDSGSDTENVKAGIPRFRGIKACEKTEEKDTLKELADFDLMWKDEEDNGNLNLSSYLSHKEANGNACNSPKLKTSSLSLHITKQQKKEKDDERRRSSLAIKEKERKRQQTLVKAALGNREGSSGKKIKFSDEDTASPEAEVSQMKRLLFEDNDDDVDLTILEKDPYDAHSHNKLMALQSQFNHDSRFKMDERFMDDPTGMSNEHVQPKRMLRYDPVIEHEPLNRTYHEEVENGITQVKSGKRNGGQFYEVSENIKSALKENSAGFSLLATYGGGNNQDVMKEKVEAPVSIKPLARRNPFMCIDSSDDEDEPPAADSAPAHQSTLWNTPFINDTSTDTFFFAENDPLFPEAIEFMNKKNSEEAKTYADQYEETRQVLRRIFKDQSLRRSKKNDAFKKKVGGSKNAQNFTNKMKRRVLF